MARSKEHSFTSPAKSTHQGLPPFARLVLDVVDSIPVGHVMTYGDIAEYLGQGGPRLVARMMSLYGTEVPWWRVLRADGSCAPEVRDEQLEHLISEGAPMRTAERVDMRVGRWTGNE